MPDGMLKWFDSKSGEAEIERGGRSFRARAREVDTHARRPGARVHFDIRRLNGVDEAVNVKLREGTRVSRRQHRFGSLVGARSADTKGLSPHAHVLPDLRNAAAHPLEVARAWASALEAGDLPAVLELYSADAVVHVEGRPVTGRRAIHAWVETVPALGVAGHARISGSNGFVSVTWNASDELEQGMSALCRISHSQIAEQWITELETGVSPVEGPAPEYPISIFVQGHVPHEAEERVRARLIPILDRRGEPVLFVRVKLAFEPDPARQRRALAQITADVDGDLVRAQVDARSVSEAVDLLVTRLEDQLEHRARHREHLRRSSVTSGPGQWRHGDLATPRPDYFDRPTEERELVRHKMFGVDELTSEEAIFDMEQLDYDFYLFRDLASGSDSMVERLGDGSYRLRRMFPGEGPPLPGVPGVEISESPAPVLTLEEALERLDVGGEPHVFFANARSSRANVVYRRYDGHYGLIAPE